LKINVFEEQVFKDIGITMCAFHFKSKTPNSGPQKTLISFFPQNEQFTKELSTTRPISDSFIFHRDKQVVNTIVKGFCDDAAFFKTQIVVRCVDSASGVNKINAMFVENFDGWQKPNHIGISTNVQLTLTEQK
jgi:hypothetical protein